MRQTNIQKFLGQGREIVGKVHILAKELEIFKTYLLPEEIWHSYYIIIATNLKTFIFNAVNTTLARKYYNSNKLENIQQSLW